MNISMRASGRSSRLCVTRVTLPFPSSTFLESASVLTTTIRSILGGVFATFLQLLSQRFATMSHSFHRAAEFGRVFSTTQNSLDSPRRCDHPSIQLIRRAAIPCCIVDAPIVKLLERKGFLRQRGWQLVCTICWL